MGIWPGHRGYTPTLYENGIFIDHRESGPRFNVSSERRVGIISGHLRSLKGWIQTEACVISSYHGPVFIEEIDVFDIHKMFMFISIYSLFHKDKITKYQSGEYIFILLKIFYLD